MHWCPLRSGAPSSLASANPSPPHFPSQSTPPTWVSSPLISCMHLPPRPHPMGALGNTVALQNSLLQELLGPCPSYSSLIPTLFCFSHTPPGEEAVGANSPFLSCGFSRDLVHSQSCSRCWGTSSLIPRPPILHAAPGSSVQKSWPQLVTPQFGK